MSYQIVDLTSRKVLATVKDKGDADRKFVELQRGFPKRKLWLKMERK